MNEPIVPREEPADLGYPPEDPRLTPWPEAEAVLIERKTYWLSTVRPDGRPHVMPVWGIWLDGRFYFSTSPKSRKGRNLARNPSCTLALSGAGLDLVVEGTATIETDEATIVRVVNLYSLKYDWPVSVRDAAIYGENGDGGPVYALTPTVAFGFGLSGAFTATRWRFP